MIEVKNLVKKYGDHVAVDHLTFTVEKGQVYGFLGPNGAGKSTTMNIMTGYIGATEGEVIIDGHDILTDAQEAKKCIGYLPEIPPVYPDMTVEEYLQFSAQLKGIKKEERGEQIAKVMAMTQVEGVADRLIKNLSKGYRQRVGLAHAIMGFPPIIILDEPTVGLDPKQIIEIRELIKELSKEHTVILSSHILSEISEVCDYVMIIAHGRLIASDTTENLTKMMEGQNTYSFLVKGGETQVREALGRVDGVEKVSIKPSAEKGILDVLVECAGTRAAVPGEHAAQAMADEIKECAELEQNTEKQAEQGQNSEKQADDVTGEALAPSGLSENKMDCREAIFYALAHAECPMMAPAQHVSLEDIFLELTEDHPDSQNKKEKRRFLAKRPNHKEVADHGGDL